MSGRLLRALPGAAQDTCVLAKVLVGAHEVWDLGDLGRIQRIRRARDRMSERDRIGSAKSAPRPDERGRRPSEEGNSRWPDQAPSSNGRTPGFQLGNAGS